MGINIVIRLKIGFCLGLGLIACFLDLIVAYYLGIEPAKQIVWEGIVKSFIFLLLLCMSMVISWPLKSRTRYFVFPVFYLFYLLCLVPPAYLIITGHKLSNTTFFLVAQTNIQEAISFVRTSVSWGGVLIFIFLTWVHWKCSVFVTNGFLGKISTNRLFRGAVILFCFVGVINCLDLIKTLTIYKDISSGDCQYKNFYKLRSVDLKRLVVNYKDSDSKAHLIIIGESSNRDHWGIYGYSRNTTPKLKVILNGGGLERLPLAYSSEKMTETSLARTLTEIGHDIEGQERFSNSYSIVDVLKKAGYKVYWFSNQNVWGNENSSFNQIASTCDYVYYHRPYQWKFWDERPLDSELIDYIENIKWKKDEKKVIFVHLIGSHAPYNTRYPKEYERFKSTTENDVNAYDNSIVFTDNILSRMYELYKRERFDSFLFFSDHGELPGVGRDALSPEMFKIPVLLGLKKDSLQKNVFNSHVEAKVPFSLDFIFDSLIGLYDIEAEVYNKKFDYFSSDYIYDGYRPVDILNGKYKLFENGDILKNNIRLNRKYYSVNKESRVSSLILGNNWYPLEDWGVWSNGRKADIEFYLPIGVSKLILGLQSLGQTDVAKGRVRFFINDKIAEAVKAGADFNYEIDVSNITAGSLVKIEIEVDKSYSPRDLKINDDRRKIGFGLRFVDFK